MRKVLTVLLCAGFKVPRNQKGGCVCDSLMYFPEQTFTESYVCFVELRSKLSLPSCANSQAEIPSLVVTWVLMDQLRSSSGRKIELFYTFSGSIRLNPLSCMETFLSAR